eukprot:SAG11_NODE_3393_length_2475_cov_43.033249_1_plen_72_part_00
MALELQIQNWSQKFLGFSIEAFLSLKSGINFMEVLKNHGKPVDIPCKIKFSGCGAPPMAARTNRGIFPRTV